MTERPERCDCGCCEEELVMYTCVSTHGMNLRVKMLERMISGGLV
jgi:hypothetical protein